MPTNTREYNRSYHANRSPEAKAQKIKAQRERRQRITREIAKIKAGAACACGESHPACLDFHHESGAKEETVANAMRRGWSLERVLAEIAKCTLICSNCHRKLHFRKRKPMVR